MKAFKKLIEKVKKLSVPVKIQLVLALLCTMAIPVYAWFAYQDRIEENYYLAVRANGSSVYNYSIRTPATTTGGTDKPTLRRSNVEEGNITNLIMGNLYKQTVTINVQNNGTTSSEITSVDHRIDVTLTSLIQLTGTSSEKDYILGHLASNSNIHLYHSFIINLTAKDDTGERNEILGGPTATTDFTINGNNQPTYSEVDVQQKDKINANVFD